MEDATKIRTIQVRLELVKEKWGEFVSHGDITNMEILHIRFEVCLEHCGKLVDLGDSANIGEFHVGLGLVGRVPRFTRWV